MGKKNRQSGCANDCGYAMKSADMFGETIGFNIDGQQTYKTACGSCISIIVMLFCAMYLIDAVLSVVNDRGSKLEVMPAKLDYFPVESRHHLETGFKFAVGVSSPRPVSGENYETYMKRYGRITAELWIDGEKSKEIPLRVCTKQDHESFHAPHEDQKDRIKKHRDANQLLCPADGGKEGVYGTHFTEKASNLKIFFKPCPQGEGDTKAKRAKGEIKCEAKRDREF